MKILWITNAPFPDISNKLNLSEVVKGWVYSSAQQLIYSYKHIQLAVASLYKGDEFKIIHSGNIVHYLIPQKIRGGLINNNFYWNEIKNDFNPEIVHIHGTEYPGLYSFIRAFGSKNVVVSIQGLISVIERYYLGGIKNNEHLRTVTVWDFIRGNSIFAQQKDIRRRSKFEKLLIRNVKHVIGRTNWDHNHVLSIHPDVHYHFCNETLRPSFYEKHWNLEDCNKYSIFISQAYYPIKGFHQLIKALPVVLKYFPKTKVYVAGNNLFTNRGFRRNGYGHYINSLINRNQLSDKIKFLGYLSEKEMYDHLCQSHIFVSPSAIENSSNSIGEAQILGVPCIASYVGGTPDMIVHNETGLLYRFEEIEMLAASICKIFSDEKLAYAISENSKLIAAQRHNALKNANELNNIYLKINSAVKNL